MNNEDFSARAWVVTKCLMALLALWFLLMFVWRCAFSY